jgi:RNA recognition motif-containing protein
VSWHDPFGSVTSLTHAYPVCRKYISKRITPHEVTAAKPGNHHYCFVDFETAEEASAAMAATNGTSLPQYGGRLRVSIANPIPSKLTRRATGADDGAPRENDTRRDWRSGDRGTSGRFGGDASGRGGHPSSSRTDTAEGSAPRSQRGFSSENWRRRDDAA